MTVLAAAQRALAGRFAAAGRPGARLLLDNVPHQRGAASGALIPAGGLAAFECEVTAGSRRAITCCWSARWSTSRMWPSPAIR